MKSCQCVIISEHLKYSIDYNYKNYHFEIFSRINKIEDVLPDHIKKIYEVVKKILTDLFMKLFQITI